MKKQLSRQTKRSRPVSSKVQTNRHPKKWEAESELVQLHGRTRAMAFGKPAQLRLEVRNA